MKIYITNIITIIVGLLIGFFYFTYYEKRKIDKEFDMECWEKLHYMDKEKSSLFMVHFKSILAGVVIVMMAIHGCHKVFRETLIIFGAGIVGLHIGQLRNELKYIQKK